MRSAVQYSMMFLVCITVAIAGCKKDKKDTPDAGTDAGEDAGQESILPSDFERFCTDLNWLDTLSPATVSELSGEYIGVYADFPVGTLETMKVIPEHPFHATSIRVAFSGDAGPVKIRLMNTFGRSYPDTDAEDGDLIPPIEIEVESPDPEVFVELDITDLEVFLLPTQHYMIVSERLAGSPKPVVEDLPDGEWSRAMMHIPGEAMPYGSEGNFRMELTGDYFCEWEEPDRWFGKDETQLFSQENSTRVSIADLNGDGHDDIIVNAGGPLAFFGDGQGGFSDPGFDPFPDAISSSPPVFGDVDNDGDLDAFSRPYVAADNDGDGETILEGDCNDADDTINTGETEIPGNGVDDDCDLQADDGTDTSDNDSDGVTIAAGDCDDTRDSVYPGGVEILDRLDNNCDGQVDETFVNKILLNDGSGHFSELINSGVETLDHSTAAGFGDGDGDGNLDIYWGNWLVTYPNDAATQDRYFEGSGDGNFTDAQTAAGLLLTVPYSCYGVMWNDFNNDGWQDIYVSNYHLYPNQLWQNQGDGSFVDMAEILEVAFDDIPGPYSNLSGGHSYGGDFGDVDNDGDMDFFLANLAHPRVQPWSDPSMFNINQGPPDYEFVNMREEYGFIYDEGDVNATFLDFDNDMDLDIAIASLYTGHFSRFYRNDGEDGFVDVTYETNTAIHDSVSVVWSDVDEDGDPDIIIADRAGTPNVTLFINRVGQDNNWIELVLEGTATNRGAVGARVNLEAGGVTQMRDIRGGGGHENTQNSSVVHFGLGQESSIDHVSVRWVGGATEVISGITPNGRFVIVEGSGTGTSLK